RARVSCASKLRTDSPAALMRPTSGSVITPSGWTTNLPVRSAFSHTVTLTVSWTLIRYSSGTVSGAEAVGDAVRAWAEASVPSPNRPTNIAKTTISALLISLPSRPAQEHAARAHTDPADTQFATRAHRLVGTIRRDAVPPLHVPADAEPLHGKADAGGRHAHHFGGQGREDAGLGRKLLVVERRVLQAATDVQVVKERLAHRALVKRVEEVGAVAVDRVLDVALRAAADDETVVQRVGEAGARREAGERRRPVEQRAQHAVAEARTARDHRPRMELDAGDTEVRVGVAHRRELEEVRGDVGRRGQRRLRPAPILHPAAAADIPVIHRIGHADVPERRFLIERNTT